MCLLNVYNAMPERSIVLFNEIHGFLPLDIGQSNTSQQ